MNPPQRIASLLPSATEIVWALGLGDRVVAVSHECDFPAQAAGIPRATRSLIDSTQPSGQIDDLVREQLASGADLYELDRELLVRLRPELIITQGQCDVCAVRLDDVVSLVKSEPTLAGTRILALNPSSPEDIFEDVLRIGDAAGAGVEAVRLYEKLRRRVSAINAAVDELSAEAQPRVVCIEWIEPLMTAGNWVPRLVELAGGVCLLATEGQHSPYVSWESIRQSDPDVLVVAPCGFDLARTLVESAMLKELEGWNELAAVRRGRVWAVDGNSYFNRSGPRIVDSLEILAHVIYPERFALPESGVALLR